MPSDCIVSCRDHLIAGTKDSDSEKLIGQDMLNQRYSTPLQFNGGYIINQIYYSNINFLQNITIWKSNVRCDKWDWIKFKSRHWELKIQYTLDFPLAYKVKKIFSATTPGLLDDSLYYAHLYLIQPWPRSYCPSS